MIVKDLMPFMKSHDVKNNGHKGIKGKVVFLLISLTLISMLCTWNIVIVYAQHSPDNKIAVVFEQLHVKESHTWSGCANWEVFGSVEEQYTKREIVQQVLKGCLHENNTYPTIPTTAIVEEFPKNAYELLWVWVLNRGWIGFDLLNYFNLDVSYPSASRTLETIETADYNISFQLYNCGFFPPSQDIKFICNYPPGQYYQFEGYQMGWQRGFPPVPDNLEGCGWPFC